MPELPEVETVVRDLRPHLTGATIAAVQVGMLALRRPWDPEWNAHLIGQQIESIQRRGKWIVLNLANGRQQVGAASRAAHRDSRRESPSPARLAGPTTASEPGHLVIHLGMTGQLRVFGASDTIQNHTHLILTLDRDRQLRFRDIRRFGSATWFADSTALERFFEQTGLGPEPFDLKPAPWRKALARTSRCLKAVLLDQTVVAGVGNIYADEALYQARLDPGLRGRDVDPTSADRLRRAVVTVLNRAIEKRGSTIRDYVGGSGLKGGYQEEFLVYAQTGQPCRRCRTPIARQRLAGRSTHYCPKCQKAPAARRAGL